MMDKEQIKMKIEMSNLVEYLQMGHHPILLDENDNPVVLEWNDDKDEVWCWESGKKGVPLWDASCWIIEWVIKHKDNTDVEWVD